MSGLSLDPPTAPRVRRAQIRRSVTDVILAPNVLVGLAFVGMVAYFALTLNYFLTGTNVVSILQASAPTFILAAGFSIALIGGGMDLSVGAGSVLAGVVAITLSAHGAGVVEAFAVGILVAVASGVVNGLLVTRARINPMIATLGTLFVLEGIGWEVTGGVSEGVYTPSFLFAQGRWLGVPVPVYFLVAFVGLSWVLLARTKLGRHFYAVGGSAPAARQCALNVERYRLGLYALAGLFTGISGVLSVSMVGVVAPTTGPDNEFVVVTAVLLGGIGISGGRGSMLGTLLGVLFLTALSNALVQANANPELVLVIQGALLIAAVAVDQLPRGGRS